MNNMCFLAMTFVIMLALLIVLVVILKDGKFRFSLKKTKENDALLLKAEHHRKK